MLAAKKSQPRTVYLTRLMYRKRRHAQTGRPKANMLNRRIAVEGSGTTMVLSEALVKRGAVKLFAKLPLNPESVAVRMTPVLPL